MHQLFVEEWCNSNLGSAIQYVQGKQHPNSARKPWTLSALADAFTFSERVDPADYPVLDTINIG